LPTPTYTALANITLGSSASSITFSSIPATYRDLVLVADYSTSPSSACEIRFNGDTGSNYSTVTMRGDGTSAFSTSYTAAFIQPSNGTGEAANTRNLFTFQVMDYSATDKHKTSLLRMNNPGHTQAQANRWANTAAITSVAIYNATFLTGATFALYGIAS
jgi:hypothetical protein